MDDDLCSCCDCALDGPLLAPTTSPLLDDLVTSTVWERHLWGIPTAEEETKRRRRELDELRTVRGAAVLAGGALVLTRPASARWDPPVGRLVAAAGALLALVPVVWLLLAPAISGFWATGQAAAVLVAAGACAMRALDEQEQQVRVTGGTAKLYRRFTAAVSTLREAAGDHPDLADLRMWLDAQEKLARNLLRAEAAVAKEAADEWGSVPEAALVRTRGELADLVSALEDAVPEARKLAAAQRAFDAAGALRLTEARAEAVLDRELRGLPGTGQTADIAGMVSGLTARRAALEELEFRLD